MRGAMMLSAALLLTGAGQPAETLRPGLWEIRNDPDQATLDGRVLDNLPIAPVSAQQLCISPAEAANPGAWLARDAAADCTLSRVDVSGGRVDVAGTCPPNDEGTEPGTTRLTGSWSPERFAMRFETVSHGLNGTMGFSGTMVGRRIGECPAE